MFSEKCLHLIKCSLSTKHSLGLDQYLLDQRKFCSVCKSFLHWTAQPPVGSSSNSLEDLRNCRAVQFCKKQQKAPTKHMIKLFNLIPTFSFSPVIHAWFISSVIFFMQRNLKGWFHTSIFLFRFFFFLLLYVFLGIWAKERRTLFFHMEIGLQFWFLP